jgi:ABC-2 type transport system permease protein
MALFFGWLAHNDLAYDSTALWMHVASAVRCGSSDRVGRLVPVLLVGTAALAVSVPLLVSLHGRWMILLAMIVCASLFLCGSVSSLVGRAPYPVSPPGDSPFQQPSAPAAGCPGVVLVGAIVASAPACGSVGRRCSGDEDAAWAALWDGPGHGSRRARRGSRGGGLLPRRGGRLMEFAEST